MARESPLMDGVGGTIGGKVAEHLRRALTLTRVQMGPHQAAIAQTILRDFTNHVSDEVRSVMGPLWMSIADHPDVSGPTRDLARALGTQRGQAWAWIGGTATSAAMGAGLMALLTNELQPMIGAAIRGNPHMPLAVADAVAADVRGVGWRANLYSDAGQWGIDEPRYEVLKSLHETVLSAPEIVELYRRGAIDELRAVELMRRAGWHLKHISMVLGLGRRIISTEVAAAMWNRGILTEGQAVAAGGQDGSSPEDVRRHLELGGEPPPLQELLLAWRRGIVNEAQVDRAVRQGPLRFEWIDVVKSLRWQPLAPADAADAVLQGYMSESVGAGRAAESGVTPDDFALVVRNSGLPPGVELMSEAFNRGLVSREEFRTAFLESRLKNKYVDLYEKLRYRIMPQETVRRLYRLGALSGAQTLERLGHAGFSPDDATALMLGESVESVEATRELTKGEIFALYTDRAIDGSQAQSMLADLGYGDGEIAWLLAIADSRRERKYVDATITRLRAGYVAYRLTDPDVSSIMDSLRIPPAQRDELIALWDLERLAVTRGLTTAQIQTAYRRGLIDTDGAMLRLLQSGYSPDDASLLVALTTPA